MQKLIDKFRELKKRLKGPDGLAEKKASTKRKQEVAESIIKRYDKNITHLEPKEA